MLICWTVLSPCLTCKGWSLCSIVYFRSVWGSMDGNQDSSCSYSLLKSVEIRIVLEAQMAYCPITFSSRRTTMIAGSQLACPLFWKVEPKINLSRESVQTTSSSMNLTAISIWTSACCKSGKRYKENTSRKDAKQGNGECIDWKWKDHLQEDKTYNSHLFLTKPIQGHSIETLSPKIIIPSLTCATLEVDSWSTLQHPDIHTVGVIHLRAEKLEQRGNERVQCH